MKRYFVLFLSLVFLWAGCGRQKEDPILETLRETVRIYNGLLADGYRRQNMNHLIQAATDGQATKVYYHMAALGEGRVRMDSILRNMEFAGVKQVTPEKGEVTSKEKWEYRYINIDTDKAGPLLEVNYTTRYRLVWQKEKWLVANVSILYSDRSGDEEDLSFFKRPADIPQRSPAQRDKGLSQYEKDSDVDDNSHEQ